jgi:hypothetical protein
MKNPYDVHSEILFSTNKVINVLADKLLLEAFLLAFYVIFCIHPHECSTNFRNYYRLESKWKQ